MISLYSSEINVHCMLARKRLLVGTFTLEKFYNVITWNIFSQYQLFSNVLYFTYNLRASYEIPRKWILYINKLEFILIVHNNFYFYMVSLLQGISHIFETKTMKWSANVFMILFVRASWSIICSITKWKCIFLLFPIFQCNRNYTFI